MSSSDWVVDELNHEIEVLRQKNLRLRRAVLFASDLADTVEDQSADVAHWLTCCQAAISECEKHGDLEEDGE